MSKGFAGILL